MAPHNFWLKRQLPSIGVIPDVESILFPTETTPLPTSTAGRPTSSSTSTSSTVSEEVETPAPTRSSSVVPPTRPTQSADEEEEQQSSPVVTSSTPTSEGILVTAAPTPESQITPASRGTSTFVSTTVATEVTSTSGLPAQAGAAKKNDFLENKVLSGVVFAICGVVGLLIIGLVIWLATRKARQTKQLEQEIISWDPDHVRGFNNANATHASKDADTRSLDELEEKGRGQGSLEGHFTYTLPSQSVHTQPNQPAPGAYSDYYGAQRPIQVSLPPGERQPYRANW
ncbi:hypothetical protein BKA70DRAFT_1258591 [Coprinopsis sp. MPI-PUGE-AT-0042]|nr:hypothetical protein BKA70DRAFT_1258591 [Coprinopsis sp. MPI-PUGE-AT-0042]